MSNRGQYLPSQLGVKRSEETRRKLSLAHLGKKPSEETLAKKRGKKASEETRRKMSLGHLGIPRSLEVREKISQSHLGVPVSEEHRRAIGEASRRSWESLSSDEKEQRIQRFIKCSRNVPRHFTSIELDIGWVLYKFDVTFRTQVHIHRYICDIVLDDYPVIVECDGDYWHSFDWRIEHDRKRDEILTSRGYTVIHLRESEIWENPERLVRERVLPLLKNRERVGVFGRR